MRLVYYSIYAQSAAWGNITWIGYLSNYQVHGKHHLTYAYGVWLDRSCAPSGQYSAAARNFISECAAIGSLCSETSPRLASYESEYNFIRAYITT